MIRAWTSKVHIWLVAAILVTDDDDDLRAVIRATLEGAGHSVEEASDGAEALELLEADRPDLLITDMHMPDMDGLALTRALRKAKNPPAIVAMSGNDVASILEMAGKLGARATLTKPFTPTQLLQAVDLALRGPRADGR